MVHAKANRYNRCAFMRPAAAHLFDRQLLSNAPFPILRGSSLLQFTPESLTAPIACWSVWPPSVTPPAAAASPDVGFVEPMLRRRLSSLSRMMLRVAYDCARDVADARVVFASRHGELARTTTMLESLAVGDELSPTLFGMSVLNASTGLFSILQKNTAPATAVSAGAASFGYGLLEACLQLAEKPGLPVLLVYADEPAPAVYELAEGAGSAAHALALLLDSSAKTRIAWSTAEASAVASDEVQTQAFLRCLEQGRSAWHDAGRSWFWERAS